MGNFTDFVIRRNARVVMARVRGVANMLRERLSPAFREHLRRHPPMSVYGVPMVANFTDKTFRYCLYGTYGTYLSDYLDAIDRPFVFVDIGANQGLYTLVAAKNPKCRKLIAFEPVAATFALLEANVDLNGVSGRAQLFHAALSDHAGTAEIALKPSHSGVASLTREPASGGARETIRLTDVSELDAAIPDDIDIVVKVDVEGHEDVVIPALMASRHVARIAAVFFENDERWTDMAKIRDALARARFTRITKYGIRRHYDVLAERETQPALS